MAGVMRRNVTTMLTHGLRSLVRVCSMRTTRQIQPETPTMPVVLKAKNNSRKDLLNHTPSSGISTLQVVSSALETSVVSGDTGWELEGKSFNGAK